MQLLEPVTYQQQLLDLQGATAGSRVDYKK